MSGKVDYAIIQVADDRRGERLNAGIAFFTDQGLEIRLPRRLEKLRALSNGLDVEKVRSSLLALRDHDSECLKAGICDLHERLERLKLMSPFGFSDPANFVAPSADSYELWARRLLTLYIDPEPSLPSKIKRRTRLTTAIKKAFRDQNILARKGEGLGAHRLVPDVHIADGLSADFVLENGAMHVIETVDASSDVITLRKAVSEIAVSALVLEQARMTYGDKKTLGRLVYDASPSIEKLAAPSLEAAANQGASLINWASHDDRRAFMEKVSALAEPIEKKQAKRLSGIHASTQISMKLN